MNVTSWERTNGKQPILNNVTINLKATLKKSHGVLKIEAKPQWKQNQSDKENTHFRQFCIMICQTILMVSAKSK